MKTYSANAIAETFERDRGVVVRALRNTKPDALVSGRPQWKLATAARAIERHNRANGGGGNSTGIDPELAAAYATFDFAYDQMVALPTLAKRRAAAKALAPLIARTDQLVREHGKATGADAELTELRADRLFLLALRGFEKPCQWTFEQCHGHLGSG